MATNVTSFASTEPKIVNRWVQMCACIVAIWQSRIFNMPGRFSLNP